MKVFKNKYYTSIKGNIERAPIVYVYHGDIYSVFPEKKEYLEDTIEHLRSIKHLYIVKVCGKSKLII
jgi:hypothetical protein